jgi:hypothetical protein
MRIVAVTVSFVVAALAACSTSDRGRGSAADDSFVLPSAGDGASAGSKRPDDLGTIRGTLSFDDIEGGCPFLEAPDGTKYEVIFPDGWTVDRATGRLHGPDGEDVAPGTRIEIEASVARDRSSICQVGPIVVARRVIVPSP